VVRRRVRKLHARVVSEGRAVAPSSPPEVLHELRKTCKKLRYVLEVFADVFPAKDHAKAVKALRALQRVLGAFQDREVQADVLTDLAEALLDEQEAETGTMLALGALVDDLRRQQQAARDAFPSTFAQFDREKVAERFARLAGAAPEHRCG
ncbi:MAG: CHAD domain-containing protein, partial [Myxococcales bacterium]|nr:CHAD domain-containing protein [Myxococcales bacterium]